MTGRKAGMALVIGMTAGLLVAGPVVGADPAAIRRAISEMLTASRAMAANHDRGDLLGIVAGAARVIEAGQRALDAFPTPGNRHARDAAEHVREAIRSAERAAEAATQGRSDDALAHARRTLSHVRQGAGHADAL
ncbi:MAG: hypothetical protein ACOYXR_13715 [Nitrospirota bacterium]